MRRTAPLRPLIVDSAVLRLVNHGEISPQGFERDGNAVLLNDDGRRRLLAALEFRLDRRVRYPAGGPRLSYRQALAVQAQLLGRCLAGGRADVPQLGAAGE